MLTAHPLISPLVTNAVPSGYTPAQIRHAYGFDQVFFSKGTVPGTGAGQTIAIIDAYNDPSVGSDLAAFDAQFKLAAPPNFSVVNGDESGSASLPSTDAGWSLEISLDVEWAHAIAPGANILLVEANSASLSDLLSAVNFARRQAGVTAVSMSWGGSEFSSEKSYDSYFTTPSGHVGVTFVASSGDSGQNGSWPSVSPNVLSVGGTTLSLDSSSVRASETAWSGSSGGVSSYESAPAFQSGAQKTGRRTTPDVAYDANPSTGVAVYDSVTYAGQSGWFAVGGTSAGAPQWAALVAIANQGRVLNGAASLQNLPGGLYSLPSSAFFDVTSGSNARHYAAGGYDLVTGLGAPMANAIIQDLVGPSAATSTTTTKTATTTTTTTTRTTTTTSPPTTTSHSPRSVHVSQPSGDTGIFGDGFSSDQQGSEASLANGVASFTMETMVSASPSSATPSLSPPASLGLAPGGIWADGSSDVARAADAVLAELSDLQPPPPAAVLPTVDWWLEPGEMP
jgi:subtilase family serine protease